MAHYRAEIRQAVCDALGGETAAAERVFPTRVLPFKKTQTLPVICVYTTKDEVDPDSLATAPRELTRNLTVTIEGWVTGADEDTVDDAMDALALEIETAMAADIYLGETAANSILEATEMEVVQEGDRLRGLVWLDYRVVYRHLSPEAPADESLDDFETVGVTHKPGGADMDDDDAVNDEFGVEES